MRRVMTALVMVTFLLLPATAEAHHLGDGRLDMDYNGWCDHNNWSTDPDDRRIDLQARVTGSGDYELPNP